MVEMKLWHAFSADHARSATLLSRMCGELEASPPKPNAQELVPGHKAYALSSLFSTVAFLGALVNEVIGGFGCCLTARENKQPNFEFARSRHEAGELGYWATYEPIGRKNSS